MREVAAGGMVGTGLERLAEDGFAQCRGVRVALLVNQCAVDRCGNHLVDLLAHAGVVPVRVFSPEHGLWSTHQDMEAVGSPPADPMWGFPVDSLYGDCEESLAPAIKALAGVDLLLADLPDIGTRYYTYAATVVKCMRVAQRTGTRVMVLDRPNPLGGSVVEGWVQQPGLRSYVGELPVPHRHGLTLGELATLAARLEDLPMPQVVAAQGWDGVTDFEASGQLWVPPSPNMPTLDTARVYPGLCLLEGTNISEGRGTTTPFLLLGAPWVDARELIARVLEEEVTAGCLLTPACFRPMFGKWQGEVCRGVRIHVTQAHQLRSLSLGLALIKWLELLHPGQFAWRTETYEFVRDIPAIDLLLGDPQVRQQLTDRVGVREVVQRWQGGGGWEATKWHIYPRTGSQQAGQPGAA